eukprot:scaffold259793_cov17-Tisochrysis_lutea.AAC.1
MLLGQSKAPVEPPSSQGARPAETGLIRPDVVHALKRISAAAHAAGSSGIVGLESVRLAVASAVLMLPESEFMVRASVTGSYLPSSQATACIPLPAMYEGLGTQMGSNSCDDPGDLRCLAPITDLSRGVSSLLASHS